MSGPLAVWANGRLLDTTEQAVDLTDRGLLLGDGLFETLPVFNGVPFKLDEHIKRLSEAAVLLGLFIEKAVLRNAVQAVAKKNPNGHGIVRLTVTRGSGGRGLTPPMTASPSIFAVLMPWTPGIAFEPVKLATSTIRRNDRSPVSRIKSLGYLDNILAQREVTKLGAGDALILNTAGRVCCTTIANLFLFDGKKLVTPPLFEGVLPGIMRQMLLTEAKTLNVPFEERPVLREDLTSAQVVFITNSLRFTRQVTELDRKPLGSRAAELVRHFSLQLLERAREDCGGLPGDLETVRQSMSATLHINHAAG
ncbi:aminotransferase class IV [Coralliovum pocilloporae]|uniref:aminotransferase class IV n=1 Tax=Coralliovum pocilloporae TaxID=3066369 RepID=UPI003306BA50